MMIGTAIDRRRFLGFAASGAAGLLLPTPVRPGPRPKVFDMGRGLIRPELLPPALSIWLPGQRLLFSFSGSTQEARIGRVAGDLAILDRPVIHPGRGRSVAMEVYRGRLPTPAAVGCS